VIALMLGIILPERVRCLLRIAGLVPFLPFYCPVSTGREILFRISSFWIKIFSVAFGMGVISGVVMPFQFGTNWSRYSEVAAGVLGEATLAAASGGQSLTHA
jgi:cytochrome bd-type quinol oxidase subunit 1